MARRKTSKAKQEQGGIERCTVMLYEHSPDGVAPDLHAPCDRPILTMTWKGTGFCGDEHRKLAGKRILGEAEDELRRTKAVTP